MTAKKKRRKRAPPNATSADLVQLLADALSERDRWLARARRSFARFDAAHKRVQHLQKRLQETTP